LQTAYIGEAVIAAPKENCIMTDLWDRLNLRAATTPADVREPLTAAGFDWEHTGGGCVAYRKSVGSRYILITNDSLDFVELPDARHWMAGLYESSDETGEAMAYADALTLADALALAARWAS
jgi:hypothetical protein